MDWKHLSSWIEPPPRRPTPSIQDLNLLAREDVTTTLWWGHRLPSHLKPTFQRQAISLWNITRRMQSGRTAATQEGDRLQPHCYNLAYALKARIISTLNQQLWEQASTVQRHRNLVEQMYSMMRSRKAQWPIPTIIARCSHKEAQETGTGPGKCSHSNKQRSSSMKSSIPSRNTMSNVKSSNCLVRQWNNTC